MSLINPTPEQRAALREFSRAQEEWRDSFAASLKAAGAAASVEAARIGEIVRAALADFEACLKRGGSNP